MDDLGWLRCARSRSLGVHNPLNGGHHFCQHRWLEGADAQQQLGIVGDDVFLCAGPQRAPMVSTAVSVAGTSRETTVCSRITVAAAITTGSTETSGREPCAPRPYMMILHNPGHRGRRDRFLPLCWQKAVRFVLSPAKRPYRHAVMR